MKLVAKYTSVVLATLALLALLWAFREVVVLFILSLAVAAATRPLVDALIERGVNRIVSILLIYLLIFGTIGAGIALISGHFVTELELLSNNFAMAYDRMWNEWPNGTQLQKTIIQQLPAPQDLYQAVAGQQGTAIIQASLGVTISSFSVLSQFFAIVILSLYWSIDRIHFERLWLSLLPVETRATAREIWRDIENGVGAYLRSEIAQSVLAGVLLGLGFRLIGLPYPILLALISAVVWLIPWLGAVLAVVPVILVGFSVNLASGIIATGYTIIVLLIMELFVEPRIFKRWKYSSLLVVLVMIALADAFGLVGIILAPPLAAALQLLFRHLLQPTPPAYNIDPVRKIADLDQQLLSVQAMLFDNLEEISPQTMSMVDRLSRLVTDAKGMLEEQKGFVRER